MPKPAPNPKPETTAKRFTAFVVPHTHWDREWYLPFRVFQARLADVIDAVLALLSDPRYRRFTLDGQAVVLEDYLELRPEREAELRSRVQEGRLRIGPWYVLADEFLVSPEALIRNLMLGRRVCCRFGAPMPVAYTPDSFGHISQLPLLARGFGLDSVVFERGLGDEGERLGSEFCWVAADGETEVFAAHLVGTYSGATALGHVDWELTDRYDEARALAHLRAALYGVGEAAEGIAELPAWFRASLERVPGGVVVYARGDALVLMNGSDHLFPQPNLPEVLQRAAAAFPEIDFVQGDVEEYLAAARASARALERHQGELRGSRYQHILSGVLSARLYLKQANDACELLLERYAEPLSALAWLKKGCYPRALVALAWKLLLHNHPHDSICGCSIDAVHREMMTRFESVTQLGHELCRRAVAELGGVRPGNLQAVHLRDTRAVTVFNPNPWVGSAVFEHRLELPLGEADDLAVMDAEGRALPLQLEREVVYVPGRSDQQLERVRLRALATLPALGLASFRLERRRRTEDVSDPTSDLKVYEDGREVRLENATLALVIDPDGHLTLNHQPSGATYRLRLRFEDQGDAGDEYDFSPVPGETPRFFARPVAPPHLTERGPVTATVRLEYLLTLPERLADDRRRRLGHVELPLTLELTLEAQSPLLNLNVAFDNTACDHRLRLRLATGVESETVWAGGHFDTVERPLRPSAGADWFQAPQGTNHQRHFVAVTDGRSGTGRGLAVLNRGLTEYEAFSGEEGVELAVTLVRAVGWLSREDLSSRPQGAGPSLATPEAQCLGPQRGFLALYPFVGPWWESGLLRAVQVFTAPPLTFAGGLEHAWSVLELAGPLQLSACKRAEDRDSLIIRVVNPAPVAAAGTLKLAWAPRAVYRTRLDETRLTALEPTQRIPLRLGAKSVETLELVLEGGEDALAAP